MAFRNIPPNGFPALPDVEDLEAVEKDVTTLKNGLISMNFGKMVHDGANVNLDTITTAGWHTGEGITQTLAGVDNYYMLVLTTSGIYIRQFVVGMFGYCISVYMRYSYDSGQTWTQYKIDFASLT